MTHINRFKKTIQDHNWWVVQTFFIFHFIHGMSSLPLTFLFFKMVKTTTNQIWLPVLTLVPYHFPPAKVMTPALLVDSLVVEPGKLLGFPLGKAMAFSFWPSKSRDVSELNILKPWEVFALFWLFDDFMAQKPIFGDMALLKLHQSWRPRLGALFPNQNSLVAINLGIHSFFDHSGCFHEKPWQFQNCHRNCQRVHHFFLVKSLWITIKSHEFT